MSRNVKYDETYVYIYSYFSVHNLTSYIYTPVYYIVL